MTTTLDVSTHETDGLPFSANKSNAMLVSSSIGLEGLNTSTKFENRSGIVASLELIVKGDILELVSPDGKGTIAG